MLDTQPKVTSQARRSLAGVERFILLVQHRDSKISIMSKISIIILRVQHGRCLATAEQG